MLAKIGKHLIIVSLNIRCMNKFCKLPKHSRFSEQLGLQKQFMKVRQTAQKSQKSTSFLYQTIIIGSICVAASIIITQLIRQQTRHETMLYIEYYKISFKKQNKGDFVNLLEKLVAFQQRYYKNRSLTSNLAMNIIQNSLRFLQKNPQQNELMRMIQKALVSNMENNLNSPAYNLYKKYLQIIYCLPNYRPSQNLDTIVGKLVAKDDTDLQIFYLVSLLISRKIVSQRHFQNNQFRKKLQDFKNQQAVIQKNIKQIGETQSRLFTQPFQYQNNLHKKWIKFIENCL